ncbi:MAG: hypothetical protein KDC16_00165 [Saprospiraceae bacterium]|nr:hypothetical protein [Saprospiraceae bacterium]
MRHYILIVILSIVMSHSGSSQYFSRSYFTDNPRTQHAKQIITISNSTYPVIVRKERCDDDSACTKLFRMDNDGNIIWESEIVQTTNFDPCVEHEGFIYCSGIGNDTLPYTKLTLSKAKVSTGEQIWTKIYPIPTDIYIGAYPFATAIQDDKIVIISQSKLANSSSYQLRSLFMRLDTDGEVIDSLYAYNTHWYEELYDAVGMRDGSLAFLDCGYDSLGGQEFHNILREISPGVLDTIYEHYRVENFDLRGQMAMNADEDFFIQLHPADTLILFRPSIVPSIAKIRKEAGILWQTTVLPAGESHGSMDVTNISATMDGGVLVCGFEYPSVSYEEFTQEGKYFTSAFIFRLASDGTLLWKRRYTRPLNEEDNDKNRPYSAFYDVKELPDGSIVAGGDIYDDFWNGSEEELLIVKMDSDGCILPGCGENVPLHPYEGSPVIDDVEPKPYKIYPIPATDHVTISGIDNLSKVLINDIAGRRIKDIDIHSVEEYRIDISALRPSFYQLILIDASGKKWQDSIIKM